VRITDASIKRTLREAEATREDIKLFDGHGLYLHVRKSGTASWRHKFNFEGKEQLATLGTYPECSIEDARNRHYKNRKALDDGKNPLEKKREEKKAAANIFFEVAEQYIKKVEGNLAPRTIAKMKWQLKDYVYPFIGSKPISTVTRPDILAALKTAEDKGLIETAHKTLELVGRVIDYAIARGFTTLNPARGASAALIDRPVDKNLPAIVDPVQIGGLLRAIEGFKGQPATVAALRLAPHVFLRPGELRKGKWSEIDWTASLWRIPAERMKGKKGEKRKHEVPLSRQALRILTDLKTITGSDEYIFPAIGPKRRCISENTLGAALRSLGYGPDVMVPHGFRTMASTRLHDDGYPSRDVELQLAHKDQNKIRGIYNRSERIPERTDMMQKWSDYLDALRIGGNVVPIRRRA
jgi:integrase